MTNMEIYNYFNSQKLMLKNNSYINANPIKLGETIVINGVASGGTGTYTYAYYYKRSSASKWTVIGTEFGTATTGTVKPSSTGELDVKVIVKDSANTTRTKIFKVTILNSATTLSNDLKINTENISADITVESEEE